MHEKTLRDFFLDRTGPEDLSRDLEGSISMKGPNEAAVTIVRLGDGDFRVTSEQLLKVCDAVASGVLEPWKLEAVGFCLVASDYFQWDHDDFDGNRAGEVIHLWAAPQVNYPLTLKNVAKTRHLLATGENTFTEEDLREVPDRAWNVGRVSSSFKEDTN